MTVWTAQLTYAAPGLDLERRLEIADALKANAVYDDDTGRLTVTFEVDGSTARQATETATRTGGAVVSAAAHGIASPRPVRILILPTEEFVAETERPLAMDLMGVREIAALFAVSPQRAGQIIAKPEFPPPICRLASGPVYTTDSVKAFKKHWDPTRQSGRPWHKRNGGAAVAQPGSRTRSPRATDTSVGT